MIIVGIDTETTGINPLQNEVVEVGWCVYSTEHDAPLAGGFEIFQTERWAKEAEEKHGITQAMASIGGLRPQDIDLWGRVSPYQPVAVVAHNAAFDHKFVRKHWKSFCTIPWICTMSDLHHDQFIPFYKPWKYSKKMCLFATEYEINFEYSDLHRAYPDALISCKIAAKHDKLPSPHNLKDIALEKVTSYRDGKYSMVIVGGDGVYSRELNKEAIKEYGFVYNGESKTWSKKIRDPFNNEGFQRWARSNLPESWIDTMKIEAICGPFCCMDI